MSELFLRDEKVLTLKDVGGVPSEVLKVDTPELLPVCLQADCSTESFKKWMLRRSIPQNREGLTGVISEFGDSWLSSKNHASLSDQYWIKMRTENWKKINFFTNYYSTDIRDMFFSPWNIKGKKINNMSPDLATNGILKKSWLQHQDKTSSLIKAGSPLTHQEPLSEVLVSVLVEQLGVIDCVSYNLHVEGVTMCSSCENFITVNTELVPAFYIYNTVEKEKSSSVFEHLVRVCDKYEIPGAEEFLRWMVFIDHHTGNTDRNLGNIAFIRDLNTLKFIGPAPLYDSGTAYWSSGDINNNARSKMFGDVEEDIYNELKKKCNMDILHKKGYQEIINSYPCISEIKKANLIDAINKRNNRLCKSLQYNIDAR